MPTAPKITPLDLAVAIVNLLGGDNAAYFIHRLRNTEQPLGVPQPVAVLAGDDLLGIYDSPAGLCVKYVDLWPSFEDQSDDVKGWAPLYLPTDIGRLALDGEVDYPVVMRTLAMVAVVYYRMQ